MFSICRTLLGIKLCWKVQSSCSVHLVHDWLLAFNVCLVCALARREIIASGLKPKPWFQFVNSKLNLTLNFAEPPSWYRPLMNQQTGQNPKPTETNVNPDHNSSIIFYCFCICIGTSSFPRCPVASLYFCSAASSKISTAHLNNINFSSFWVKKWELFSVHHTA